MSNNTKFFFVLAAVATALGIGNIWLFPYFSYKLTGLFFVPYLVGLILLGVPLLMLEFSIGQYFNKNIVDLFSKIKRWFSAIGWLMVFNAFIVMSYYALVVSWHVIYFFISFGQQWKNDAKSYFFNNVLQVSDRFYGFTQFSLPLFVGLVISWLIIFLYVRKGFESLKKWFLVVFPFFIALMFLFLIYSLTLDNALNGVYNFLNPRMKNLLGLDVWISSFSLAVVSLGISFGIMPAFARKSGKGFITGNSIFIVMLKLLVGITLGFILFGILGFLSMKQDVDVDKLAFSDFSSEFTVLTQALPFFYRPTLMSILFFAFLAMFFIFGTAALAYSITHVLVHKFKTKHANAAILVSGIGFLMGLAYTIKPGFYIMDIVSHFVYYNILIAVLLEVIAIGWVFDSEKIAVFIDNNSALKIGYVWRFFIRYLIPIILLALLFFQIKKDYLLNYNNYPLIYVLIFGVGIVVVPIVLAFLMPQKILDRR
ncbi:hypothetical protein HYX02_04380 [Candidatus Woesearchaeota archaeon]|nr:hypothetical protein [Candidatus Woesearchaeota archaeon]